MLLNVTRLQKISHKNLLGYSSKKTILKIFFYLHSISYLKEIHWDIIQVCNRNFHWYFMQIEDNIIHYTIILVWISHEIDASVSSECPSSELFPLNILVPKILEGPSKCPLLPSHTPPFRHLALLLNSPFKKCLFYNIFCSMQSNTLIL